MRIEAATLVDMVRRGILNAVSEYSSVLCETALRKKSILPAGAESVETSLAETISSLNETLLHKTVALKTALDTVSPDASHAEQLAYYSNTVVPIMNEARTLIDKLETLTAAEYWPYPTYYDLLFSV